MILIKKLSPGSCVVNELCNINIKRLIIKVKQKLVLYLI